MSSSSNKRKTGDESSDKTKVFVASSETDDTTGKPSFKPSAEQTEPEQHEAQLKIPESVERRISQRLSAIRNMVGTSRDQGMPESVGEKAEDPDESQESDSQEVASENSEVVDQSDDSQEAEDVETSEVSELSMKVELGEYEVQPEQEVVKMEVDQNVNAEVAVKMELGESEELQEARESVKVPASEASDLIMKVECEDYRVAETREPEVSTPEVPQKIITARPWRQIGNPFEYTDLDLKKEAAVKQGTLGVPVKLSANYFQIFTPPNFEVFEYRVYFIPDIESSLVRKKLINDYFGKSNAYIFDGSSLFMVQRIPNDYAEFNSFDAAGNAVNITIRFCSQVSMQADRGIQILNLALRKSQECLKLQQVGRNFFDPSLKVEVNKDIELWPGYVTSIRQHERDILLCAEIAHKVMRKETVYNILHQCLKTNQDYKDTFNKLILGTTVLTGYNNKTYRIDDIDYDHSPSSTFKTKDGTTSYVEYYKVRYNITIKDGNQPLLMSRPKARDIRGGRPDQIFLIPELCRATGLTEKNRQNFSLMKDIAKFTKMDVPTRISRLLTFRRGLNESGEILKTFNMELARDLVKIDGREITQEKILFGNSQSVQNTARVNWTTELMRSNFYSQVNMEKWTVICPSKFEQTINNFLQCLEQAANSINYVLKKPEIITIQNDYKDQYLRAIEKLGKPDIVMFVLPNNDSERYTAIKKCCCVDKAILSQVVTIKNITPQSGKEHQLKSVASKVLIQMNAKLGGIPWNFNCPLKGLMTVGFDVTHDASHKEKSYGAMIASMDMEKRPKFFSTVNAHSSGEEISSYFGMNIAKALRAYKEEHNSLPDRIMIYRDGVGDGQLNYVKSMEVEEIKKKLDQIYAEQGDGSAPKWAYVIVNKRLNTRFFKKDSHPTPGTIIDDTVTLPDRHDFFLISQSVNQGSVSPTSYTILHNTLNLEADGIQILTYKWTHCYYNWSGTTRVPGVCMLAKKLAGLVGQYLHQPPNQHLEKSLYFL